MMILGRPVNGYTGPGDITSGAKVFGALRAYSNAIVVAGTQKLINVRRGSDSATADVLVASNGGLGVTANATSGSNGVTVDVWGGAAATGTGSITGTTLTFTGGQVGGQVTGGTVAAGTYIVSGASPTWTVNISQTVGSSTLTVANTLFIATLYDQSGNSNDLTQATTTKQPHLILTGGPSSALPWMNFHGTAFLARTSGFSAISPLPVSMSAVSLRRIAGTQYIFATYSGASGPIISYDEPSSNNIGFYSGNRIANTGISANTWYATFGVSNQASGSVRTNGTTVNGNTGNETIPANTLGMGANFGGGAPLTGAMVEVIIYPSVGNASGVESNQRTYWGF